MNSKKIKKGICTWVILILVLNSLLLHQTKINAQDEEQTNSEKTKLETATNILSPIDNESMSTPLDGENFSITRDNKNSEYKMSSYENQFQTDTATNEWARVNTTLKENGTEGIEPISTDIGITFDNQLTSQNEMLVVNDSFDNSVSFTFKGMMKNNKLKNSNAVYADTNRNTIVYKEIFPNIDLRHIVLNKEVKEDVILNQNFEQFDSFVYQINTELKAVLNDEGEIQFFDSKDELAFTMPAPLMSDSSIDSKSGISQTSKDIKYSLIRNNKGYELQLIPNFEWINDKNRVFPLYLDPSISKEVSKDTFVSSAEPSKNFNKFWSSALGEYVLRVGKYDSETGTNYSLINLSNLSDLKGASISSAMLKTFVRWSYYDGTKTGLWVDYLNSDWTDSKLTWNTKPSSTKITSTTVSRNQWASFDVTSAIKSIANGSREDYGFKFHTNANGQTYWKQLSASENSSNKTKIDITYAYPKMSSLKSEVYPTSAGSDTGYINLSWPAVKYADKYRLQLYNGKGWRTVYSGSSLKFSTKDKKLWPTPSQYSEKDDLTGGIAFRQNDGMELPMDPSQMYSVSSGTKITTKSYQFRVVADYSLGSSPVSDISKPLLDGIIPDKPGTVSVSEISSNDQDEKGYFNLAWDEVEGATSYDLMIFNGNNYERIPVGNVTEWTSKGKRLYPTEQQLEANTVGNTKLFRSQKDGRDFITDPRILYKKNGSGTSYHKTKNYYAKVIAKSSKGESLPSDFVRIYFPVKELDTKISYKLTTLTEGNIQLEWSPREEASGYLIFMYNGKEHQLIDDLSASVNTWSTVDKFLWPKSQQGYQLRNIKNDGTNLTIKPSSIYNLNNDVLSLDNRYSLKVIPYRFIDSSYNPFDLSRYKGMTKESAIEGHSIELPNNATKTLDTPTNFNVNDNFLTTTTGTFDLSWNSVSGATGYIVSIFNGKTFEEFDVKENTTWTTADKKIFPTEEEIRNGEYHFHKNMLGRDFERYPDRLYSNAKYNVSSEDAFYLFKVRAYNDSEVSNDTEAAQGYISDSDEEWLESVKDSDRVDESFIDEESGMVSGEKLYTCEDAATLSECNLNDFKENLDEQQNILNEISNLESISPPQLKETYSEELNQLQSNVAIENLQEKLSLIEEEQRLDDLNEEIYSDELSEEELLKYQEEEESYGDDGADESDEDKLSISDSEISKADEVDTSVINSTEETSTDKDVLESVSLGIMYDTQDGNIVSSKEYLDQLKANKSQRLISGSKSTIGAVGLTTLQKEYRSSNGKKFALKYDFSIELAVATPGSMPYSYKVTRHFFGKTNIDSKYVETVPKKTTSGVKAKSIGVFPTQLQDRFTLNTVKFRKVAYKIEPKRKSNDKYTSQSRYIKMHLYNLNAVKYHYYQDAKSGRKLAFPKSTLYKKIKSSSIADARKKWNNYRESYRRAYEKKYGSSPKKGNERGTTKAWAGYPVHHIRPLEFGGSPTNNSNLIPMKTKDHHDVHRFWDGYLKQTKKPQF